MVDSFRSVAPPDTEQVSGRLEAGTWADCTPLPLPYPSIFDRPVAPSKLDPVLLRAKMRGEAVYADERGLL